MNAQLVRTETSDQGTFGTLTSGDFSCFTGELPWKENAQGLSCIPAGTYDCVWHDSPSKGWVYEITNVPNRSDVLIHIANYCGATPEYRTDLLGCIGLGHSLGQLEGQQCILESAAAIHDFNEVMQQQPFSLEIIWADGVGENA